MKHHIWPIHKAKSIRVILLEELPKRLKKHQFSLHSKNQGMYLPFNSNKQDISKIYLIITRKVIFYSRFKIHTQLRLQFYLYIIISGQRRLLAFGTTLNKFPSTTVHIVLNPLVYGGKRFIWKIFISHFDLHTPLI